MWAARTIRLGIRVWRPVHRSDFDLRHGILVRMNPFGQDADAWVRPREGGGWMARFYDDGVSRALFHARVSHPVGTLFQLWLPASWARGQAITIQSVSPRGDDALELTAPR